MKIEEGTPEFDALKASWDERVKDGSESLDSFVEYLLSFEHDYGTIVHATHAAMRKCFLKIDNSPQGGITGYQAQFLMWKFIEEFGGEDPVGRRIVSYSDLCFPQAARQFTHIPRNIWEQTREFARKQLEEFGDTMVASVRSHMIDVRDGKVPFGLSIQEVTEE